MDVQGTTTRRIFVPLPKDEVLRRIQASTGWAPGFAGTAPFWGKIESDGTFWVQLRRLRRRNLRPFVYGSLKEGAGGTWIELRAEASRWARPVGRTVGVAMAIGGLVVGASVASGWWAGAMSPLEIGVGAGLAAWLPVSGVLLSGFMVAESVDERELALDAFSAIFPEIAVAEARGEAQGAGEDSRSAEAETDGLRRAQRAREAQ